MAHDPISDRFEKRQQKQKLTDLSRKARSKEDLEGEEELLEKSEKVEPIQAEQTPGRNDPCPCGSGKKYKKCCGAKSS